MKHTTQTSNIKIIKATKEDLPIITSLFDAYRVFYKQSPDIKSAEQFIEERLTKNDSTIFLAMEEEKGIGFTQLYSTFSSVNMNFFYILNDLFVLKSHRKIGIGTRLLQRAKELAIEKKAIGLQLETAIDNPAQDLYENLGWVKNAEYFQYFWTTETKE